MTAPYRPSTASGSPEAPTRPPKRLRRSDWLNARTVLAAGLVAFLAGGGVFVAATALEAGGQTDENAEVLAGVEATLADVQEFLEGGRERTYRGQALTCEVQDVLGIVHDRADDPCLTAEVLRYYDVTAGERGQARLACLITVAATGTAPDRCVLVLAELDLPLEG